MPLPETLTAQRRVPRLPGLDLLRAIAIAWVMLYHATIFDFVPDPDGWYASHGWMGVDIFFVLSGFLIASQLFKPLSRGLKPDYAKFFTRRALRTLPAYVAIIAIYFLVPAARELTGLQPLWKFVTFTENISVDLEKRTFSHVWSLCVKEQFYLLLPSAMMILSYKPTAKKVWITLSSVLLFGATVRGYLWLDRVAESPFAVSASPNWRPFMQLIYYPTWSRLDGLLAGVATAALKVFRPRVWRMITARANALLCVGAIGITLSIILFKDLIAPFYATVFGFPLLAFSIALIVAAATTSTSVISRYRVPGAGTLAAGSYSLYLSHKIAYHLVAAGIIPTDGATGLRLLAIAVSVAVVFGTSLYWMVERPFLKLRDRLDSPSRSAVALPLRSREASR